MWTELERTAHTHAALALPNGHIDRSPVQIGVRGRTYTLRPTVNAIADGETATGHSLPSLLRQATDGRLCAIRILVWALLQPNHAHEIRTMADAGNWIERAGGVDVVMAHLQLRHTLPESRT